MEVRISVQHVKATKKCRTYEGREEGIHVVVEIPSERFEKEITPAPAEMIVVINTH